MESQLKRLVFFSETKSNHVLVEPAAIKGRQRDGCHADFAGQPFAEFGFTEVFFRHRQRADVDALEISAFARQQPEFGAGQALAKQIAFALVESRQIPVGARVGHETRQTVLHRGVDGEHIELVDLAEFRAQ